MQLQAQMATAIANGGSAAHNLGLQMEKLQKESEDIRDTYAGEASSADSQSAAARRLPAESDRPGDVER